MFTRGIHLEPEPVAGSIASPLSSVAPASYDAHSAELVRVYERLELRCRLLEVVARISTSIARSSDLSTAVSKGLRMIGEAAHFSRCLLLQRQPASISENSERYTVFAEWCAPGVRSHQDCGTATFASEDAAEFIQNLRHGEIFWCRIDEVDKPLRAVFERMEIRATGCAPILVDDELWGTLAFDDCVRDDPWDEAHIDALTAVANTISNALQTQYRAEKMAVERAAATQKSVGELAKANAALRRSISRLADVPDVEAAMVEAISTASEVTGSSGGALGLYLPEQRGFRTIFQVVGGERVDLEGLSYHERLYSLDEEPIRLAWEQFHLGDGVLWCPPDSCYLSEDSRRLILEQGFSSSMLVALKRGAECIGYLGFFSRLNEDLSAGQRELLRAIADQISLMLELWRLAHASENSAIMREREIVAFQHAAELTRANEALRKGVDGLVRLDDLSVFLREMLKAAVETAGAQGGAVALLDEKAEAYRFAALLRRDGSFEGEDSPLLLPITVSPCLKAYLSAMMDGNEAWSLPPEDSLHASNTLAFHVTEQNRALRHIPMVANGLLIGWLGLGFADANPELGRAHSLLRVLADQMTMAVEMLRVSEEAKSAAVAREREHSARQSLAEVERVNNLLVGSAQVLAQAKTPDEICELFLLQAVTAMQGTAGGLLEVVKGTEHRFAALVQGNEIVPKQMWENLSVVAQNEEITREDRNGVMARLLKGEDVYLPIDDEFASWAKGSADYHRERGNAAIVMWPFYMGRTVRGNIGIAFSHTKQLTQSQRETLKALSNQASLALELNAMTAKVKLATVVEERERAAQARTVELARTNEQLALRDRLLTASAKALEHLMSTRVFAQGVNEALRQIGEAAELSRVKVLLQDRSNDSVPVHRLTYEWWAEGLQSQASLGYVSFPDSSFQNELNRLRSENRWWGQVEDWPIEIQPAFQAIGVSSVGIVPIYVQLEYVGLVAFDHNDPSRDWSEPEIDALTIAARGLGAALAQEKIMGQLAHERERAIQERAAELCRTNEQLSLRDRLLTASAEALERLISATDFASGVADALRHIGETAHLSRVQVLIETTLPSGELAHELVHEWWDEPLESQKTMGYVLFPNADQPEVMERLHHGGRWWAKTEDWPSEVQPIFRELGIVWTGVVPIFVHQKYVGMVAFDQCNSDRDWSEAEIGALTIAAGGIGAALSQERMTAQLQAEREQAAQDRASELVKANLALRSSVDDLVTQSTTDGILTSLLKQAIDISNAHSGAILSRVAGSEFEYVTIYADGVICSSQQILAAGTNTEMRLASRLDPTGHFRSLANGETRWREVDDEALATHLPRSTVFHQTTGNRRIYDFPYKVAGQVFGYLSLAFADHEPPSETVQETIKALATQVGLALEFRRISEQVERAAVTEERNKFARDLHDTLAQGYAAILMQLGAAEQTGQMPSALQSYMTRIDDLARSNLAEARRTVSELRSSERVRAPLLIRISELARQLESAYGSIVQVSVTGTQRALPPVIEDELYLIAQESLTNALKHAQSTEVTLAVCFADRGLRLKVKDNGKGFSSEERGKPDHFGLQTMQERAQRIDANLTIISELGFGTEILTLWSDPSLERR